MGRLYVSIKPFKDDTGLTYADDFIDVSEFVVQKGVGKLITQLDNNTYDIGVLKNTAFNLTLMNTDGRFNAAEKNESIFNFTRNKSLVLLEWDVLSEPLSLGFHPAGRFPPSTRQKVGEFLLNDDSLKGRAVLEAVTFKCFSKTILFNQEIIPFGTITNGQEK